MEIIKHLGTTYKLLWKSFICVFTGYFLTLVPSWYFISSTVAMASTQHTATPQTFVSAGQ